MIERLLCLADKFFLPNPLIYKTNPRKSVFIFGGKGGGVLQYSGAPFFFFSSPLSVSMYTHTHTAVSLPEATCCRKFQSFIHFANKVEIELQSQVSSQHEPSTQDDQMIIELRFCQRLTFSNGSRCYLRSHMSGDTLHGSAKRHAIRWQM